MTDIVKRLKAKPPKGFVTSPLMIEAADEIERLRGQIVFERLSLRSALDKLRKLDGDIERLRKDKAELVEELWGIALHSGSREANEMARAAIAKATGGE